MLQVDVCSLSSPQLFFLPLVVSVVFLGVWGFQFSHGLAGRARIGDRSTLNIANLTQPMAEIGLGGLLKTQGAGARALEVEMRGASLATFESRERHGQGLLQPAGPPRPRTPTPTTTTLSDAHAQPSQELPQHPGHWLREGISIDSCWMDGWMDGWKGAAYSNNAKRAKSCERKL